MDCVHLVLLTAYKNKLYSGGNAFQKRVYQGNCMQNFRSNLMVNFHKGIFLKKKKKTDVEMWGNDLKNGKMGNVD